MDDQAIEDRVGLRNMPHYASILFNMGMLYEKQGKRGKVGDITETPGLFYLIRLKITDCILQLIADIRF